MKRALPMILAVGIAALAAFPSFAQTTDNNTLGTSSSASGTTAVPGNLPGSQPFKAGTSSVPPGMDAGTDNFGTSPTTTAPSANYGTLSTPPLAQPAPPVIPAPDTGVSGLTANTGSFSSPPITFGTGPCASGNLDGSNCAEPAPGSLGTSGTLGGSSISPSAGGQQGGTLGTAPIVTH